MTLLVQLTGIGSGWHTYDVITFQEERPISSVYFYHNIIHEGIYCYLHFLHVHEKKLWCGYIYIYMLFGII